MPNETVPYPHRVHPLPDSIDEADDVFPVPLRLQGKDDKFPKPNIGPDYKAYLAEYEKSVGPGSDDWWREQAKNLDWYTPFKTVRAGGFEHGDIQWL